MESDRLEKIMLASPLWLSNFIVGYRQLSKDNLNVLATIYHKDITFIDPLHQVEGLEQLSQYFQNLYQNLSFCEFVIGEVILQNNSASIFWTMTYQHPKLNKGKPVNVLGTSHLKAEDDKVIYHRDYLDLGAMLYEQIPLLGGLTQWIKKQASK